MHNYMKANKNTLQIGIPYTFRFEGNRIDNYQMCTELHELHGWVDYVVPEITEYQRLLDICYDSEKNIVTHDVQDYTQEEIDLIKKSKVPQVITPRQLRTQLILNGISIDYINSIIDSLSEPQKSLTKIAWEYSTDFDRNNEMLKQFANVLGLNENDIDDIFINASKL